MVLGIELRVFRLIRSREPVPHELEGFFFFLVRGTPYVAKVDLKLCPASASLVVGIQASATISGL
jgi:hypothetical protein